jgi:uncharacterized surface protein with fasciclin (FAS1) repeats
MRYSLLITILLFASCLDPWKDHNLVQDDAIKENLFQKIKAQEHLSIFADLLVKTGYDIILASSKTYTVWAPDNAALNTLDPEILNDSASLKLFVGNHISNQSYLTTQAVSGLRVLLLNGKYASFEGTAFDDATIISANQYARNGILHVINQFVVPRKNIWEYIHTTVADLKTSSFLQSLDYEFFDADQAIQTGVDPLTGKPVYKEGTGWVNRNSFLDNVKDVENEAGQYTFFLLTDNAYDHAYNKLNGLFKTGTADSTALLNGWHVVKDLVVEGRYTIATLPDTLVSVTNVKIPVNKAAIVQTYNASNGIVYVIGTMDVRLEDKFPPLRIEGEQPVGFSRTDKSAATFYRIKQDLDGNVFRDIMVYGHQIPEFYIQYHSPALLSHKYKVYWRAVAGNDDSQTVTFQQRIAFNTWNATTLPYTTVALNNYNEVYLGEYTPDSYGALDVFLVAAATATTGQNTLSLDYLKLVPVFE